MGAVQHCWFSKNDDGTVSAVVVGSPKMGLESAGSSKSELSVMEHGELGTKWGACGSNMAGAEITKIGKHIKTKHVFITRQKASNAQITIAHKANEITKVGNRIKSKHIFITDWWNKKIVNTSECLSGPAQTGGWTDKHEISLYTCNAPLQYQAEKIKFKAGRSQYPCKS